MTDSEALRRFVRVAAGLEPDLARWVTAAVWRGLSPSRRRRIRDELLREAARLLPPASAWRRAHEVAELARRPASRPGVSTAAGLVALAVKVYRPDRRDRELSVSQAFRILTESSISPIEMQAGAALDLGSMLDPFAKE